MCFARYMNIWFLLAFGPAVAGVLMSIATRESARGVHLSALSFNNSYVASGQDEWVAGHRAALPVVLAGTAVVLATVTAGWLVAGFTPSIAPWALAALVILGLTLLLANLRSKNTSR
jgi:hypothetical protein